MARPTAARLAALEAMRAIRAGGLADQAFDRAAARLDVRDRAWTYELVYGTLRLRGRLDWMLAHASSRPLAKLDADVLDILRLGAYQLIEMGGVPAYAAVSEAVDMTRLAARSASGFVNAVLQTLRRDPGASTFPVLETDPVGHLSTWGSHPAWLVERWVARYGVTATARLVDANNQRPQLYLRVLGSDRPAVAERLRDAGIVTEPLSLAPRALRVLEGGAADALDAGPVIAQDPAAGLVADYAMGTPRLAGGPVLDLTAAPGGKALAIAADGQPAEQGPTFVVAADRSVRRLARVTGNLRRLERQPPLGLGPMNVSAVVADARHAPFRPACTVMLDAPCTGTGTLRRHPDGRWRLRPDDLGSLAALQRQLLDAAAALVLPGGLLVYSTCSLEPEENEMQVASFLERHGDFVVERGTGVDEAMISDAGALHVLPQVHGVDGAYAVRLRRGTGDAPMTGIDAG